MIVNINEILIFFKLFQHTFLVLQLTKVILDSVTVMMQPTQEMMMEFISPLFMGIIYNH